MQQAEASILSIFVLGRGGAGQLVATQLVDRVWLAETDIATDGQLVSSYKLEAQVGGSWQVRARAQESSCACAHADR